MASRSTKLIVLLGASLVAAVVLAVGVAALDDHNSAVSRNQYQVSIVKARDRLDYALERVAKSQSVDELFQRMDEAVVTLDAISDDLADGGVAVGFEDENRKLVSTFRAFASELAGTLATMREPDFAQALPVISSLSFPQWDAVNRILETLASQGIDVEPLARH